jgi:hypothetical protein
MREEAGRDPAGIFSAAAEDAPGEPSAEDIREADSVRLRLQRLCTCERQRTRRREPSRRMAALGGGAIDNLPGTRAPGGIS